MSAVPPQPGGATPTPLRKLADPISYQVLPSRRRRDDAADAGLMLPPPPPHRLRRLKDGLPRAVVPEEDYVRGLSDVIERNYFPDLPKLSQQLAWLQAVESGDPVRIARLRAEISSSLRHADAVFTGTDTPLSRSGAGSAARPSVLGGQLGATPLHAAAAAASGAAPGLANDDAESLASWSAGLPAGGVAQRPPRAWGAASARHGCGMSVVSGALSAAQPPPDAAAAAAAAARAAAAEGSTVDGYLARFSSEDTASFETNFASFAAESRRRTWWAHEEVSVRQRLLMLVDRDGTRAAAAGRIADAQAVAVGLLEGRQLRHDVHPVPVDPRGLVRTWPHRPHR